MGVEKTVKVGALCGQIKKNERGTCARQEKCVQSLDGED
jgi:hypothetical protein